MATEIGALDLLRQYVDGVMNRADHHGQNVNEIILTIAGCIAWKQEHLEAYTREGEMVNALWVEINGNRYFLSYDHADEGSVMIKENNNRGNVIQRFDNTNTALEVKEFFQSL